LVKFGDTLKGERCIKLAVVGLESWI